MKGICAILSVVLIVAGVLVGNTESPSAPEKPAEAVADSLFVGDFADSVIPARADRFCRTQMGADEALSVRLPRGEDQAVTLGELLSVKEYEQIYLSLKSEDASQEDYWAVLNLIRQTQPQASIYLLGPDHEDFLRRLSDGRNIFYLETL